MTVARSQHFTQTDPLQPDIGSPYPSAYVYASNRPTVIVDPSGLRGAAPVKPNSIARTEPNRIPDELAQTATCGGTAHDQFDCALWDVWRAADRDFGTFVSVAGRSLGGLTLVRFPNRFRRQEPPPKAVVGESGWNRQLIDGDNSPARHFVGFFATAFSWGAVVAATGLERNESGGAGSSEQDIRSGYYAIALAARSGGADFYTDSQFRGFIRNVDLLTGSTGSSSGPSRPSPTSQRRTGGEYIRDAKRLMGG